MYHIATRGELDMEGDTPARLEESALKILFRASSYSDMKCVCRGRMYNKSKTLCGWENVDKKGNTSNIRIRSRKNGNEGQRQTTTKSKNQRFREKKTGNESCKKYFRNYKSRKQHIESYRKQFSSIKLSSDQEDSSSPSNHDKNIDPYLPDKGDHSHLYKRLNLLQTLSDFYNVGLSPRDLRRQAYLPPVTMTYTKTRTKSITKIDPKEMECTVADVSKQLNDCQIKDTSTSTSAEFDRVCDALMDKSRDSTWREDVETPNRVANCSTSSSSSNARLLTSDLLQPNMICASQVPDRHKPSQKIIDGLSGSLKQQLKVLRSGHDLHRQNYPFHLNSDRFVHLKQNHIRNDNREKTVSSIPNAQKGQTLYISILGRNPLNKALHDS